jgi:hypothetical protein
MATRKKADRPPIAEARVEEIRADARSGRNWAAEKSYGPSCTCGMKPEAGHSNVFGVPVKRGVCYQHGA